MFTIHPTARLRPSPFLDAAVAAGMVSASIYNRMILPTSYGDLEAEYRRILEGVSLWDVGAERQVELRGPDAARLAQILSPRDLSRCAVGQGKYIPLCNHRGTLINDPILLKLDEDRFWFSIADADVRLWARAIAAERGLDVEVDEPDVSPLAVQGPKSEDVVASLFGDWVRELRYFHFRETALEGIPLVLCRSGWSKQGGFELFLMDGSEGTRLWNLVVEAGRPWDIGPGAPATPERVESGLVSVGGDTDDRTNPFEVRLGKYVDLHVADDVIGIAALRKIDRNGPARHQLGVVLEGEERLPFDFRWEAVRHRGREVGHVTHRVWSPRMGANIGYALVAREVAPGETVEVEYAGSAVAGVLRELPFL